MLCIELPRSYFGVRFRVFGIPSNNSLYLVEPPDVYFKVPERVTPIITPIERSEWNSSELTRIVGIWPLAESPQQWLKVNKFQILFPNERLRFLKFFSTSERLLWCLLPIFRRLDEMRTVQGTTVLDQLRSSEQIHFPPLPDDSDDSDEEEIETGTLPVRWTMGWNHASSGGPPAYGDDYREGVLLPSHYGMLRPADSEWELVPAFPPEGNQWLVDPDNRRDCVRKMAGWLNRAQLATEYSHTGTIAHARLMMNALSESDRISDVMINADSGVRRVNGRYVVDDELRRFVEDEGHDRTYGVAEFAANAHLRHLRSFLRASLDIQEAKVLAIEPSLYNPYAMSRAPNGRIRFLQTRTDLILHLDDGRVVVVEYKMLMATGRTVRPRVIQAGPIRQALTNAFLLMACTGVRASHVLVYYSTPVQAERATSGYVAFAILVPVDLSLIWQRTLFERVATSPFSKEGERLYADGSYLVAYEQGCEPSFLNWIDWFPRVELANRILDLRPPLYTFAQLQVRPGDIRDLFLRDPNTRLVRIEEAPEFGGDVSRVRIQILRGIERERHTKMWLFVLNPIVQGPAPITRPRRPIVNTALFVVVPDLRKIGLKYPEARDHEQLRSRLYTQSAAVADQILQIPEVGRILERLTVRQAFTRLSIEVPEFVRCFHSNYALRPTATDRREIVHRLVHRLVNYHTLVLFSDPFADFGNPSEAASLFLHNSCRSFWTQTAISLAAIERTILPYVSQHALSIILHPGYELLD